MRTLRYALCTTVLLAASCFMPDYPIMNRGVIHCSVLDDTCPKHCYCEHQPLLLDSLCVYRERTQDGPTIFCAAQ